MKRRRYQKTEADHFFDDVVEMGSLLPWWVTLPAAAVLFYFVPFSAPLAISLEEPTSIITTMLVLVVQGVGKYLIPLALLLGAVLSIFGKIKSNTLFRDVQKNGARATVEQLSWHDFEFLLSEWFKKQGFSTELTGGGGADGGIDIKLYKDKELYLVQCKHYKAWKVSVNVVRELYGVMAAEKAVGGYVVTSGRFTKEAWVFATGKQIELIDGNKLTEILEQIPVSDPAQAAAETETCPKCGAALVAREGKYGKFMGCSNYPRCRFAK